MKKEQIKLTLLALAFGVACSATAQTATEEAKTPPAKADEDLTDLNLDDLANMQVTTASKKAESLFGVAASLYVVTAEDIKRSGAVNIPEALRLVPGLQVGQLNSQNYAVSVRGFNGAYSKELLVLIDGRSIYNTLWGGVYWEDYNVPMEEIERIEVVRGPGGTLWGANAVNGIINIITKSAKDTQGWLAQVEAGNEINLGQATLRYGGQTKDGHFRVSAFGIRRGPTLATLTTDANDDWYGVKGTFRFDGGNEKKKLTVLADWREFDYRREGLVATTLGPAYVTEQTPSTGGSFLTKWDSEYSNGSSSSLQVFYEKTARKTSPIWFVRTSTLDFDFQFSPASKGDTNLIWGAGYRHVNDDYTSPDNFLRNPTRAFGVFSGFVQRDQKVGKNGKLTIGTKVEHNEFSGFEVQPSLRYAQEGSTSAWWGSVSRAVRTPNQVWEGANASIFTPMMEQRILGDPDLKSVSLLAFEAGLRKKVNARMTVDLSAFYNRYEHLDGAAVGPPFMTMTPFPHAVLPIQFIDVGKATTYGFELASKMQMSSNWRVDFGYAFLEADLPAGALDWNSAKHQVNVLSTLNLSDKLSFDQGVYFLGNQSSGLESYTRVDLQLRYKANDGLELAVGGRNLGNGDYQQTAGTLSASSFIRPQFFAKATWKF